MDTGILLLIGTLIIGIPIIIMGGVSAWRERKYEEQAQAGQ